MGIRFRLGFARVLGTAIVALAAMLGVSASAAPFTDGIALCGTQRSAEETLFLRQQRLLHDSGLERFSVPRVAPPAKLSSASTSWPTPRSQDAPAVPNAVGQIAIVEATAEIVSPPNQFDLQGRSVLITPSGNGFHIQAAATRTPTPITPAGVLLDLDDDDAARIELPFEFTYYGKTYPGAYVHSDGNLTFNAPEASSNDRNYARAAGGPPRIAPLFEDFDPSVAGEIRYAATSDRAVVTWYAVPLWAKTGIGKLQTFQLALGADNSIEFRYGDVNLPAAVVGVFPGDVTRPALAVDWSAAASSIFDEAGILAEVFTASTTIDEFAVFHQFLRDHQDAYDSVIVFNEIGLTASQHALAHAYTVRNEVTGIGKRVFDSGPYFGSPRRTGSFVNMGSISGYPDNPLAPISYRPDSSMLTVLAHEVGHQFLANAIFKDPETGHFNPTTLGRQLSHWSFYFNTDASVLEGNAIRDNGPAANPRFETVAASQTYSALDKYLMGFLDPSEVGPSFLVEAPSADSSAARSRSPKVGVRFNGVRKEVRIEDIIAAHGDRRPDTSVSQRHFRHAFVLVVDEGTAPSPETLRRLERLRRLWRGYFSAHLDGRATTATELVQMLHLSTWPAGGLLAKGAGRARVEIAEARQTDLTVQLSLGDPIATVPAMVTIPAGALYAEFDMSGIEPGVTRLDAEASEPGYDQARTRLKVRAGLTGMQLQRLHPPELYGLSGNKLRFPLRYELRDEDHVRYSGIEMEFLAAADGSPVIATPVTDAFGQVSVNWLLGTPPGGGYVARLKDAPEVSISTTVQTIPGPPTFGSPAAINAASQVAAGPGRGLAPGSLVTLHGSGLAFDERGAEQGKTALPNQLGVTRVHVDGVSAPLLQVSPSQVTFQLPFWAQAPAVSVRVATPYGRSAALPLPVSAVQPGIFPARIRGFDGSGETSQSGPVPRAGGMLQVHCTGLGAVSPAGKAGLPGDSETPQSVVAVTEAWIDERPADVTVSRLSTSEAGIYVVVIGLPGNLEPGEHRIQIAVAGVRSNAAVFRTE